MSTIEDRVTERLAADRDAAQATLDIANAAVQKAGETVTKAAEKVAKALDPIDAGALADKPHKPTDKQREKVADTLREQVKIVNVFVAACARRADALAAVQTLSADKEYQRRLKEAQKIGARATVNEPMSGAKAAELVLLSAGHAMHYTEITRVALQTGVVKLTGKTPEATMSAYLAKAAAKGDTFVRVEPGVFDLKARVAKASAKVA